MRFAPTFLSISFAALTACAPATTTTVATAPQPVTAVIDSVSIHALVSQLDLERYKATIKGLTQFGDRRQGTARNRAAVDWIEAQLKSYGCTNTERITYDYQPDTTRRATPVRGRLPTTAPGGARLRGNLANIGVNSDSLAQPDAKLRALNTEQSVAGERQEVYCTKIGTTHPDEMYIVGGHMDGIGWGQAVNDDASGSAIVMELARIFSQPDVQTERSIRFALWNNEETGLNGARAYAEQRGPMQGKESPAGSGKYPEPKWLGMIQHDMMMVDHGPPTADGKLAPEQRPEADINIEFAITSKFADDAMKMAFFWRTANEKYATHYPAAVGPHMTNTDSDPFKDLVPSLSLRENERGSQIGGNWDPTHHQPTGVLTTFTDKDFMLGLTSAQTTLGAIGQLTKATIKK